MFVDKKRIRETLNLSMCADNSTDTKMNTQKIICQVMDIRRQVLSNSDLGIWRLYLVRMCRLYPTSMWQLYPTSMWWLFTTSMWWSFTTSMWWLFTTSMWRLYLTSKWQLYPTEEKLWKNLYWEGDIFYANAHCGAYAVKILYSL